VLVPRKDRFYIPSFLTLPYTRTNPSVRIFRHAMAIDEQRRMFRLNRWTDPQEYVPNPFAKPDPPLQQEIKQVWFSGVHADIGGGDPEAESALSKFPLDWMIAEAVEAGLHVHTAMRNHLVLGHGAIDPIACSSICSGARNFDWTAPNRPASKAAPRRW
jgi:uncharacterized protein (DUF2235 family)